MNRRVLWCAALATGIALAACAKPGPVVAAFFHQELCPECGDYQRAEVVTNRLLELGRADRRVAAEAWQVVSGQSMARLKELQVEHGLPDLGMSLPCLVVDGRVVAGYPAIEQEISRLDASLGRTRWRGTRPK